MEINIAEILRRCPIGMELESTIFEKVKLKYVSGYDVDYPITIETISGFTYYLTKYGQVICNETAKCVIFPKGRRSWEGFQGYLKDGDVVFGDNGCCSYIAIYKSYRSYTTFNSHVSLTSLDILNIIGQPLDNKNLRLATKEEKQKLFEELKSRGYKWNEKSKTLEKLIKPEFKVGDIIQTHYGYKVEITEVNIDDNYYMYLSKLFNGIGSIDFKSQNEWELVPAKFDFSNLKPFDKVLVRNYVTEKWNIDLFSCIDDTKKFKTITSFYCQCIPFEGNEHLNNKVEDCDNFYQIW